MKLNRIVSVVIVTAAIISLNGCFWNRSDEEATGTITFAITPPQLAASVVPSALDAGSLTANQARVWLYRDGDEIDLDAGSDFEFVGVNLAGGTATVTIQDVPEGSGYSITVVTGRLESSYFAPLAVATSQGTFSVTGGREVTAAAAQGSIKGVFVDDFDFEALGSNVVALAKASVGTNSAEVVFGATPSTVFTVPATADTTIDLGDLPVASGEAAATAINSVSSGQYVLAGNQVPAVFVNTNTGIFSSLTGTGSYSRIGAALGNVMFSGAFVAESGTTTDPDDLIIYYSRLGGLGGASVPVDATASFSATAIPWSNDIGAEPGGDLEGYVRTDQNPVRAQAANVGGGYGFFATVLGSFRADDRLFGGEEISLSALLGGQSSDEDTSGLDYFGIAYPGTKRPMQINELQLATVNGAEHVVAGTPRGAFYYPSSVFSADGGIDEKNIVQTLYEIPSVIDKNVVDMAVSGGYLAILTEERLVVLRLDGLAADPAPLELPARAALVGEANDLLLQGSGATVVITVAGTQGISQLTQTF